MVDRLSGFDGQGTVEKECGQRHLGRADNAFLEASMNQVNPASRVAGRFANKYKP